MSYARPAGHEFGRALSPFGAIVVEVGRTTLVERPKVTNHSTIWTKICGFRDAETASHAAELGAAAIGLNFYQKSVRFVEPQHAAEIVAAIAGASTCVGLFVNEPIPFVCETAAVSGVDIVQLHGDESPTELHELKQQLPQMPVIKAFAVGSSLQPVANYLAECKQLGSKPDYVLLDAQVAGEWGGTGQTAPWDVIVREYKSAWPPLILAGGLSATNVRAAIDQVQPWGVDVASGVELKRGVKDADLIAEFMQQVGR